MANSVEQKWWKGNGVGVQIGVKTVTKNNINWMETTLPKYPIYKLFRVVYSVFLVFSLIPTTAHALVISNSKNCACVFCPTADQKNLSFNIK